MLTDLHGAEARLVLAAARRPPSGDAGEDLGRLVAAPLDWPLVLRMAERHRVIPLLHRALGDAAAPGVPDGVARELRRRLLLNTRRNLLLSRELGRLVADLAQSGLRAIPYKGVVLAREWYGRVSDRQVWDLDLLVSEREVEPCRRRLAALGYRPHETFDHEQSFRHDDTAVEVDLHWSLVPRYVRLPLDFEKLWERREHVTLAGGLDAKVPTLSPEDQLLVLSVQLAKDCWERYGRLEPLVKVADVAALARTAPLDWATVEKRAETIGVQRMLRFALSLAAGMLDAPLPASVGIRVSRDATVARIAGSMSIPLLQPPECTVWRGVARERLAQLALYMRLRERPSDRWHHGREILAAAARRMARSDD